MKKALITGVTAFICIMGIWETVFDEATSALDNETENSIMESINQNCDEVYRVENGRMMEDNVL